MLQAAVGLGLGLQRQDREGAGGEEMLHRPALVIALMGDGGDDARLPVRPGDPADARLLAQARASPVGGHEEGGRQHLPVGQGDIRVSSLNRKALHAFGPQIDARVPAGVQQAGGEIARRQHVGERLVAIHFAGEGEEGRPHRVLQAAVGDHHVEDGLGLLRHLLPNAQRLEHPASRSRDGVGALVPVRVAFQGRVAHDHVDPVAERLPERQREGQPGETAARDDDARCSRACCCAHRSISQGIFGRIEILFAVRKCICQRNSPAFDVIGGCQPIIDQRQA
jgi:hypothetical protein